MAVQLTPNSIIITIETQTPFEHWQYYLESGFAVMENLLSIDEVQSPNQVFFISKLLGEMSKLTGRQIHDIQHFIDNKDYSKT
jgi:hypothetical protein